MIIQDIINGLYEGLGSIAIFFHIKKLLRDKEVKGINIYSIIYFASWGVWNLYYYPSLNQWFSFIGGLLIVITNFVWIGLMIYYNKKNKL